MTNPKRLSARELAVDAVSRSLASSPAGRVMTRSDVERLVDTYERAMRARDFKMMGKEPTAAMQRVAPWECRHFSIMWEASD